MNKSSKKRKFLSTQTRRDEKDPDSQLKDVKNYMFHAIKLLTKAVKKSQTMEVQKLARKTRTIDLDSLVKVELELILESLKSLSLEVITLQLLHNKLPSLRYLHPILPQLLLSLPSFTQRSPIPPTTPEAKARNRIFAHKLVREAWLEIARAIGKKMGEVQEEKEVLVEVVDSNSAQRTIAVEETEFSGKRLTKRAARAARGAVRSSAPLKEAMIEGKSGLCSDEDGDLGLEVSSEEEDTDDVDIKREGQYGNSSTNSLHLPLKLSLTSPAVSISRSALTLTAKRVRIEEISATKHQLPPTTSSAFLPSLASGYISYSDSDEEDVQWTKGAEKVDKLERKNRRGQRARQAIWEKKFGGGANHIVKTNGITTRVSKTAFTAPPTRTGTISANMEPILERIKSKVDLDEHPSWIAKKRAKALQEERQNGAAKGKKIIFD